MMIPTNIKPATAPDSPPMMACLCDKARDGAASGMAVDVIAVVVVSNDEVGIPLLGPGV